MIARWLGQAEVARLARAAVTATSAASAKGQVAALTGGRRGLTQLQRGLAGVGCGPSLARLALLAGSPAGTPLPTGTAAEVAEATGVVLAQAEQAVSAPPAGRRAAAGELSSPPGSPG